MQADNRICRDDGIFGEGCPLPDPAVVADEDALRLVVEQFPRVGVHQAMGVVCPDGDSGGQHAIVANVAFAAHKHDR